MPEMTVRREKGKIWSPVRKRFLHETPEEAVRQEYLCVLINEYGFSLEQIDEEVSLPGERGNRHARADFVIWRTVEERQNKDTVLIVVECKAENVAINQKTYQQGTNYANNERAKFFVAHNRRSTKFFKVDLAKRAPNYSEVKDIPKADASDKEIKELLAHLKPFEGKEFAELLHSCHNIIRNNEHLDPAAAFDEIAKILFIKVWVERRLKERRERKNLFTVAFLRSQIGKDPINTLFGETKEAYHTDKIFGDDERINLRAATVEAIVAKLESYNLSETSEDVKGIAFERFLGGTFRGEIGQFFTPRPVVEFIVQMLDPQEGEIICDPASGSGGFLIRCFEILRERIAADVDAQYKAFCAEIDKKKLPEAEKAKRKLEKYNALQAQLDPVSDPEALSSKREASRIWHLSNQCIYGTDANDRMARTSKMNMIMHGDGHGGVHHHNGLINVNGIFEGRFKVIATNPPFGAVVKDGNVVLRSDYVVSNEARGRYHREYGSLYDDAVARIEAHEGKSILSLFQLPRSSSMKTELVFIERCLDLLAPGGRLGIVLPEGIFNNPSLGFVREFTEDRAFLRAIVSLPQETFTSSGASVKCSILILEKFTTAEAEAFANLRSQAISEITEKNQPEVETKHAEVAAKLDQLPGRVGTLPAGLRVSRERSSARSLKSESEDRLGRMPKPAGVTPTLPETRAIIASLKKELLDFDKKIAAAITLESRNLLKTRFDYPIFLYEAEKVGISATGEPDLNELYPNDRLPAGIEKTCLELYREFRKDPAPFFKLQNLDNRSAFAAKWQKTNRWSPGSFRKIEWNWSPEFIHPLSVALRRRLEFVDRNLHSLENLVFGSLHFDGELSHRDMSKKLEVKGRLFFAHSDDVVYSKIDARNGAIGIVPESMPLVVFSSEYPIYEVSPEVALPEYVKFLFRTKKFRERINSLISGASGRKRVEPSTLETIEVPIPSLEIQQAIVSHWRIAEEKLIAAKKLAADTACEVEEMILGVQPVSI